jgi:hypothetical protein
MILVEWWPVDPRGAVGIMVPTVPPTHLAMPTELR